MAARVEEAYSERDEAIDAKGDVIEVEIPYLVFDLVFDVCKVPCPP